MLSLPAMVACGNRVRGQECVEAVAAGLLGAPVSGDHPRSEGGPVEDETTGGDVEPVGVVGTHRGHVATPSPT